MSQAIKTNYPQTSSSVKHLAFEVLYIAKKIVTRRLISMKISFILLINLVIISLFISVYTTRLAYAKPKQTIVGSIEGELLVNGSWLRQQDQSPRRSQTLSPIWSTRPALDLAVNHYIWMGAELGVTWLSEPNYRVWQNEMIINSYKGGRRMVWTPSLRTRIDFPLDCRWVIEGLFSAGLSRWSLNEGSQVPAEDSARWGFAWRMNIGIRYALNTQVHLLLSGGYSENTAFGEQDDITFKAYPLSVGLRGGF